MGVAMLLAFVFTVQDETELAVLQDKVGALSSLNDPEARWKEAETLAGRLRAWLQRRPESPDSLVATELLSDCLKTAGRIHAFTRDFAAAEKAFDEAIHACDALAEKLKAPKPGVDPEVWHERLMAARYLALLASTAKIDALKEHPNALAVIRGMLSDLRGPIDDFMLSYEFHLSSQDVLVRTSRAYQTLAELQRAAGDPAAERTLSACFGWTRKSLLLSKAGPADVRELAARLVEHDMSANNLYGAMLRARNAKDFRKRYDLSLAALSRLYELYPELRTHELGLGPRVESAKAWLGLGKTAEALRTIRVLLEEFREPRLRARIILNLGELVLLLEPPDRLKIAQFVFDAGDYVPAARQFQELRAAGGAAYYGPCTLRIGQCYYFTQRTIEAVHAFRELMDPKYPEAPEAAILLSRSLRKLGRIQEAEEHEAFMILRGWGPDEMIRNQAVDKENRGLFADAIPLWEKLAKEGKPAKTRIEAMARIGYDHARLSENENSEEHWRAARSAFREFFKHSSEADSDDILMALANGSYVMLRLAKDPEEVQEVLDLTREAQVRFPKARPETLLLILTRRVEARRMLRQAAEAEAEFKELKALHHKTNAGIGLYHRALEALVKTFREARMFDKEREYILELPQAKDYGHMKTLAETSFQAGRFAESRDLFEKLLGAYASDVKVDPDPDMEFKIRYRIVKCHLAEGNLEKAAQTIDLMKSEDPGIRELRADILYESAKRQIGNERVRSMTTAAGLFSDLAAKYKRADPEAYYRCLYKKYRALFEYSAGQTALRGLFDYAKMRGEAPSWGESGSKEALNQLMKLMDEKIPSKR